MYSTTAANDLAAPPFALLSPPAPSRLRLRLPFIVLYAMGIGVNIATQRLIKNDGANGNNDVRRCGGSGGWQEQEAIMVGGVARKRV